MKKIDLIVDCADPDRLAKFWQAALGYEKVLHWDGETVRHYALNNDQEYFAEATEAFFGTNDFYPFTRSELKRHDPKMFELLHELWGVTPPNSQ